MKDIVSRNQFSILSQLAEHRDLTYEDLKQGRMLSFDIKEADKIYLANKHFIDGGGKITTEGLLALDPYRVKRAIFIAVLASGENNHFETGKNNQNMPGENSQF